MFYLFLLDHFCYLGGACFKETPDFVFHKLFVGELEFYLPRFYCFSKCIPFGVLGLGGQRVYCFAFESFPLCVCFFLVAAAVVRPTSVSCDFASILESTESRGQS